MTCHDAREKLSALRRGMDLTERALVHAHVMQCAECRKEREEQPEPTASSPTVAAQAALTVAEVARAGVARTAGLLTRVEHVRSGLTRAVHMLVELRSPLMTAFQAVARATTDFARAGVPRVLDVLARLRGVLSISLTVSGQAAMRVVEVVRAGVARIMALSTRVSRQLPGLFVVAGRAAATLIGHVRFGIARVSGVCSSWMSAFPRAGRTTTEAARAGVTRAFELPTQLIAAGRTLSVRAAQASPAAPKRATAWPVRPLLSAGTGMVGLVILVAALPRCAATGGPGTELRRDFDTHSGGRRAARPGGGVAAAAPPREGAAQVARARSGGGCAHVAHRSDGPECGRLGPDRGDRLALAGRTSATGRESVRKILRSIFWCRRPVGWSA
jgi:hypothetical protein